MSILLELKRLLRFCVRRSGVVLHVTHHRILLAHGLLSAAAVLYFFLLFLFFNFVLVWPLFDHDGGLEGQRVVSGSILRFAFGVFLLLDFLLDLLQEVGMRLN